MSLTLYGYRYSVYCWVVRLVLAEKAIDSAQWVDVNPFTKNAAATNPHPFNRVPLCKHHDNQTDVELFETHAISQYLDDVFPSPGQLQPTDPLARARMQQFISITDSYAYPALVRGVFEQEIVAPKWGLASEPENLSQHLTESARVLGALDALVANPAALVGDTTTLADLQLAPMMAYFTQAPAGAALLRQYPRLLDWWAHWRQHRH